MKSSIKSYLYIFIVSFILYGKIESAAIEEKTEPTDQKQWLEAMNELNDEKLTKIITTATTPSDLISLKCVKHMNIQALHIAVNRQNLKLVKLLLSARASVNAKDNAKRTPLHEAVATGNKDIADELLSNGANYSMVDFRGQKPIDLISHNIDSALTGLICSSIKSQQEKDIAYLFNVIEASNLIEISKIAYRLKFYLLDKTALRIRNPIELALKIRSKKIVFYLLYLNPDLICIPDEKGITPLYKSLTIPERLTIIFQFYQI